MYELSLLERYELLQEKLGDKKEVLKEKEISKRTLEQEFERFARNIEDKEEQIQVKMMASSVIKRLVDDRTEVAYTKIEEVLNWALSQVPLKQRYQIRINDFEDKRFGRGVTFDLVDIDTKRVRSIKNQTGTAISQIVSFLLSVVIIAISGSSRVMVLDERFSGLDDEESIKNFSDILQALSENEGFQFHIVEQNRDIASNEDINVIALDLVENSKDRGLEIVGNEL